MKYNISKNFCLCKDLYLHIRLMRIGGGDVQNDKMLYLFFIFIFKI